MLDYDVLQHLITKSNNVLLTQTHKTPYLGVSSIAHSNQVLPVQH